ncbi:MAG: hypothetical protein ABL919_06340 [Methylococcales bacterium]
MIIKKLHSVTFHGHRTWAIPVPRLGTGQKRDSVLLNSALTILQCHAWQVPK